VTADGGETSELTLLHEPSALAVLLLLPLLSLHSRERCSIPRLALRSFEFRPQPTELDLQSFPLRCPCWLLDQSAGPLSLSRSSDSNLQTPKLGAKHVRQEVVGFGVKMWVYLTGRDG
jgi:hypothetical protein